MRGFWWRAACVTGVCCFPVAADVRGERAAGSGTGRSPAARGGAAGVLEAAGRSPDDGAAGNGSRGACDGIRFCVQVRPVVRSRRRQCRWLHSSLRVPWPGPGTHGAGPRQGRSGGVNQDGARAAIRRRRGREPGDLAPGRWPGKAVHAARAGGGTSSEVLARQRSWPSRRP